MEEKQESDFRTFRGYQILNREAGLLTSAMEDYLEMIYRQCRQNGYSRVGKLSALLHVKPSSASKMIFKLADMGYVRYDRYEIIRLTESGETAGEYLLHRHRVIEKFLRAVGSKNVLEETELIEHSLGYFTVESLGDLLEFFRSDGGLQEKYRAFRAERQKGRKE